MAQSKLLEALFRISRALVGKQDLNEILQQIVLVTADLIDSKICTLMLLSDNGDKLTIKATQSHSTNYRNKPPVKIGRSISGNVIRAKEPMQVEDVTQDPRFSYGLIAREEGVVSLLSVPMMIGDKAIGVLNCYTQEKKKFDEEDVMLVQTIANQAALAIEHNRIVNKEFEARNALETRMAVDKAKRLMIKQKGIGEQEAHQYFQQISMRKGKPIKDIADAYLLALELQDS